MTLERFKLSLNLTIFIEFFNITSWSGLYQKFLNFFSHTPLSSVSHRLLGEHENVATDSWVELEGPVWAHMCSHYLVWHRVNLCVALFCWGNNLPQMKISGFAPHDRDVCSLLGLWRLFIISPIVQRGTEQQHVPELVGINLFQSSFKFFFPVLLDQFMRDAIKMETSRDFDLSRHSHKRF